MRILKIRGADGTWLEVPAVKGTDGADGATFTPHMSVSGDLSWTNNKGLTNPPTINLMGKNGIWVGEDTPPSGYDVWVDTDAPLNSGDVEEYIREMVDARTGYDGTVYNSVGTAIREQVGSLKDTTDKLSEEIGTYHVKYDANNNLDIDDLVAAIKNRSVIIFPAGKTLYVSKAIRINESKTDELQNVRIVGNNCALRVTDKFPDNASVLVLYYANGCVIDGLSVVTNGLQIGYHISLIDSQYCVIKNSRLVKWYSKTPEGLVDGNYGGINIPSANAGYHNWAHKLENNYIFGLINLRGTDCQVLYNDINANSIETPNVRAINITGRAHLIQGNNIIGTKTGSIFVGAQDYINIVDNFFDGTSVNRSVGIGIMCYGAATTNGSNTISNNRFYNQSDRCVHLQNANSCVITGNHFHDARRGTLGSDGTGAEADISTVDSDIYIVDTNDASGRKHAVVANYFVNNRVHDTGNYYAVKVEKSSQSEGSVCLISQNICMNANGVYANEPYNGTANTTILQNI